MIPLFSNAYLIAKENIAYLKYESIKNLLEYLNVEQNAHYSTY